MSSSGSAYQGVQEQTIYCFHGALDILMRSVDGVAVWKQQFSNPFLKHLP